VVVAAVMLAAGSGAFAVFNVTAVDQPSVAQAPAI
jgi:hypothetical protein